MIAASAPIDRIDIAFIICFLVHKEAGVDRVKRYPKQIATKTLRLVRKDSTGRVLFTADAHRDNRKRFIVSADEKLTAFLELESQLRLMRLYSLL